MKKVYICSSVRESNFIKVTETLKHLPNAVHLRPRMTEKDEDKFATVEVDVAMINYCDELWVVGEFGRDCSWEIGYATGIGKPIRVFRDASNEKTIEADWMLHHGILKGNLTIHEVKSYSPKASLKASLEKVTSA